MKQFCYDNDKYKDSAVPDSGVCKSAIFECILPITDNTDIAISVPILNVHKKGSDQYVANNVLNEAPKSNDATHIVNNVCLTTMGTQKFSMAAI